MAQLGGISWKQIPALICVLRVPCLQHDYRGYSANTLMNVNKVLMLTRNTVVSTM